MKGTIAVLDTGLSGLNVFSTLATTFPKERFLYQNNLKYYPYSERPEAEIRQLVENDITGIMRENPAVLIVVSDTIIEYGAEKLKKVEVPVIRIDDAIVEYANRNYEQKNIVLLARRETLDANLYQKRFNYNHLYSIASDELEKIIEKRMTKTAQSFAAVKEAFRSVIKKEIDLIITGAPFLLNLQTEIREYVKYQMMTDVGMIIANKLSEVMTEEEKKGRGERIVKTNVPTRQFRERAYWLDCEYKIREYR
ncbi:MAG TPA: hypothetical protein GX390_04530 [Acholeplasmataceae bacterium]|jgi:glutamate racemase|nr:hypothetical protein [Acholeplasmataceae bacterium]